MKKLIAFLLSMTMLFSLCSCSLLKHEEEVEVPTKRAALKAAEEEYDLDLDFVSEDISRHEDEATWVFVNEEVREDGSSTTTTVTVTWSANHPDRFRFDDDVTYVEPLTIIEETPTPTPTEVPVETTVETEPDSENPYSAGYISDNNSYINEDIGIEVTLPDGWAFATSRQLASIANYVTENMPYEEWAQAIENGLAVTEFYMYSADNTNINLTVAGNNGDLTPQDHSSYAVENLSDNLAAVFEITDIEATEYEIDGITYYGIEFEGIINATGDTAYQRQIYIPSDSGMMATLTITSHTSRDDLDILFDVFNEI